MSLPQPPEGILDQSVRYNGLVGWTKTPKNPGLFGVLKARLTGIPNEYGNYSSYVNISEADADKIIENMKKDPRGYPTMDQTSGSPVDWMDRQRRYQEWLVEAYLNFNPNSNDMPVELEIINVEPKEENDPTVVKIEVPLDPPRKRRRIRLKRIPNTIKKSALFKSDVASRMAAAFDKRLEDLIDVIQRPPTTSSTNVKPEPQKKETLLKKRYRYNYKASRKSASSFNQYLYNKIGSAFSLAAEARREASEAGAPKQRAGFFVTKALTSEFGGDFLRRARGTFSSNPKDYQDPALSKGQRFRSLISPYLEPPKVRQLSLDLDSATPKEVIEVRQVGLSATIKPIVKNLSQSYKNLFDKINSVSVAKSNTTNKEKEGSNILESLADQMVDLLDSVKKSVSTKKKIVKTKQLSLNLTAEIAREEKSLLEERSIESTQDTTSTYSATKAKHGNFSLWGMISSLFKGNKKGGDDDDDSPSGGGGGGLLDFVDDIFDRRRGGSRRDRSRRSNRYSGGSPRIPDSSGSNKPSIASRFKNFMGGKTGRNILGGGALIAGGGLLASTLGDMGSGIAGAGKGILDIGTGALGFFTDNPIAKRIAIASGKFGGRMIPAAGTALSGVEAVDRASRGDSVGAWLAGLGGASGAAAVATAPAAATGWGAAVPLAAEATSMVSDIGLFGYDIFNALTGRDFSEPKKKMSEGGVMIGEAGPELVANNSMLSSIASGKTASPDLSQLGVILGVTSQVIEQAGPAAGSVRPYIENKISPLKKIFGAPTFALTTSIGKGISNIQKPKPEDDLLLVLMKALLNFIGGREIDDPEVPTAPPPMGQGTDFWTLAAIVSMEDGRAQGQADVAQSVYNRVADGGYGATVYDVLTADGQYQPAYNDPNPSSGINPLFKSITDLESAAVAVKDGNKRIHGRDITIEQAREQVQKAAEAIQNPTLQQNASAFVQGRTDFTATGRGKSDEVQRPEGGNTFYWEYGSGKMIGQPAAPIPTMNSAVPPSPTGDAPTVRAVGDSLAEGVAQQSSGRIQDNATQGLSPSAVNTSLRSAGISRANTGKVVLSTGLANDPNQRDSALQQFQFLQSSGIPYVVLPLSDESNADILRRTGKDTNRWLRQVVPTKGGTVAPAYNGGADKVHPTADTYRRIGDAIRSGN